MNKIKIWFLWNYITMFWSIIRVRLGFGYSKDPIPVGLYCYNLHEKSTDELIWKIKTCPYYTPLKEGVNGCKFLGNITSDIAFDDMRKICTVKKEIKTKTSLI
jgi:hypothetical protein